MQLLRARATTPIGAFAQYALPSPGFYSDIVTGADGNLWFTETSANQIAMVTTAGVFTEYSIPTTSGDQLESA
jgi:streptogramin lyase